MQDNGVGQWFAAALAATLTHAVFEFHGHVAATALSGALLLGLLANPGYETMLRPLKRVPGVRLITKLAFGVASLALLAGVSGRTPVRHPASRPNFTGMISMVFFSMGAQI